MVLRVPPYAPTNTVISLPQFHSAMELWAQKAVCWWLTWLTLAIQTAGISWKAKDQARAPIREPTSFLVYSTYYSLITQTLPCLFNLPAGLCVSLFVEKFGSCVHINLWNLNLELSVWLKGLNLVMKFPAIPYVGIADSHTREQKISFATCEHNTITFVNFC